MFSVCVEDAYVGLLGRHVVAGQSVEPGMKLLDIMPPSGVVETIIAQGWGIVAHIEGERIFPPANEEEARAEAENEDGGELDESRSVRNGNGVFPKGSMICQIMNRDGYASGTIKGLTPRPTSIIARRRARGINLNF